MAHKGLALRCVSSNVPGYYSDLTSTRAASPAPVWLRGPAKFRNQRLTARTRVGVAAARAAAGS